MARQQLSCHLSVNVLFWWLTEDGIDIDELRCFTETMSKRVAVILSGCGVYDGTEIHEASAVLVHLSRAGAKVRDFGSFHFIGKRASTCLSVSFVLFVMFRCRCLLLMQIRCML